MRIWSVVLVSALFVSGAWAQGVPPRTAEEYLKAYVQSLTPQEAARWVSTQGNNFIYVGANELFPGLGPLLRGRDLKVYVGEETQTVAWLDRAGVRYTLFRFPGTLASNEGLLVALDGYVLGVDREQRGRFVLVKHKEVANILYRMFAAYEAFARRVVR